MLAVLTATCLPSISSVQVNTHVRARRYIHTYVQHRYSCWNSNFLDSRAFTYQSQLPIFEDLQRLSNYNRVATQEYLGTSLIAVAIVTRSRQMRSRRSRVNLVDDNTRRRKFRRAIEVSLQRHETTYQRRTVKSRRQRKVAPGSNVNVRATRPLSFGEVQWKTRYDSSIRASSPKRT